MSFITGGLGTDQMLLGGLGVSYGYIVIIPTGVGATFENVFIEFDRQNSYAGMTVTLNSEWGNYFNYTTDNVTVYFTVKERWVDALQDALVDVIGAPSGENILFNLSVNDTDIPTRDGYKWQVQVRDAAGTVVSTPIGGLLDVGVILRQVVQ